MTNDADREDTALLKNLVPLNALSEEHLGQLISRIRVEKARAGDYLFREGDTDHQNVYLLDGTVSLWSGSKEVDTIASGSNTARFALAHQWPRKFSVRAQKAVRFVRVDSRLLSDLLVRAQSQSYRVSDLDADADGDWMSQVLRSRVFQQIPAANMQNVLRRMGEVAVSRGDVIVRQGDVGDYYYMVVRGQCTVTRFVEGRVKEVAHLGPGECFGEEALVSDSLRGGTVTMATDGVLVRLSKDDFVELIRRPLTKTLDLAHARALVADGAVWLDVRPQHAFEARHLPDAINLPFDALRVQASGLDLDRTYVVCAAGTSEAAVAAFLLRERGFEVVILEGDVNDPGTAAVGADDRSATTPDAVEHPATASTDETQDRFRRALQQRITELRQAREALAGAEARIADLQAENRKLGQLLAAAREESERQRRANDALQSELDEAQEILQEASAEESTHQWERNRMESRMESLRKQLQEQQEVSRVLEQENEQTLRRLDDLRAELDGRSRLQNQRTG